MKAVILAGGKGERLMPLTKNIPKPMIKIDGKTLLEYQIELFRLHGIKKIMLCLHYLPQVIQDYFKDGKDFGVNISYSIEKKPLGTAGAIKNTEKFFDETFVVMYGDNLTNLNLKDFLDFHRRKKAIATIALHSREKNKRSTSFILMDDENKVQEFVEKPNEKDLLKIKGNIKFINAGIYILKPEILKYIPLEKFDFAYDLFPLLLNQDKRVYGYLIKDYFREVGRLEKLEKVKEEIERGNVKLFSNE